MAEWNENPSWNGQQAINNGEQYSPNDTVTPEDMNAFVENLQYLYQQGGDFEVNPYPVGSIYMSSNSTSPAYLFGGSWEQIYDKFLLAAGSSYYSGQTGGQSKVTLSVNEMPSHGNHLYTAFGSVGDAGGKYLRTDQMAEWGTAGRGWSISTSGEVWPAGRAVGGGQSHENMPPYLAVYMWKRIA
jgi:hypothetical protein